MFKLKRSAASIAVATVLMMGSAQGATNTSGSIYGEAKTGSTITFKSDATGLSRSVVVEEDGKFRFKNVPPGHYVVTDENGNKRDVFVAIGKGVSAMFNKDVETISVLGSKISTIDTTSAESTMVFNADQISLLPVGRNTTAVALLTPGTVASDPEFGNLPTFGGSSAAENGFYIDGFDVTNIRTFLRFANLPFDAVKQTQVKTGGYGAEYGRSLGGVTNTVTRSGTNEWEFGAAAYYTPESLRGNRKDVMDLEPDADGGRTLYGSADTRDVLTYNFSVGGPIIEDTLFFYTNIEFRDDERNYFYSQTSTDYSITSPKGMAKLDWYVNSDHLISATYIENTTEVDRIRYNNTDDANGDVMKYTGVHGDENVRTTTQTGGDIFIFNYSGQLTDDLSMSVMYGQLEDLSDNVIPRNVDEQAATCPYAWDTVDTGWSGRTHIGCWNTAQSTVKDPDAAPSHDERTSYKIDFDYQLGDHNIRFGYNSENFQSFTIGTQYSGGDYYRYFSSYEAGNFQVNGVELPEGSLAVRHRTSFIQSGEFEVDNTAFYLEDSWQFNDELMIYAGIRNETFTNYAADGEIFVEADNLWAPRLGFAWDVDGDSTSKVYGTWGRYYIPIAANTNIRATRTESSSQWFYLVDGWDPATGQPIYNGTVGAFGERIGGGYNDEQIPDPRTIAVDDLTPMHQDELILGYQTEVFDNWTAGVKGIYRTIKDGMDDFCGKDGFYNWAVDQGLPVANAENDWHVPEGGFDVHSLSGCIIVNPGNDVNLYIDTNGDGNVTLESISNDYFNLPEYKRSYTGLELTLERGMKDGWYANFSYVLSQSKGNIEGYVNSTLGQEDAGATQDFDHSYFQDGSNGDLPNDHRHQLKFYGGYELTEELMLTTNIVATSGIPLSRTGYIPTAGLLVGDESTSFDEGNFSRYGASSFYYRENGETVLGHRGNEGRADWYYNVSVGLRYMPNWAEGLMLKMDIFNAFDSDQAIQWDQQWDYSQTDVNRVNANFGKATQFQSPRSIRFSARYNF